MLRIFQNTGSDKKTKIAKEKLSDIENKIVVKNQELSDKAGMLKESDALNASFLLSVKKHGVELKNLKAKYSEEKKAGDKLLKSLDFAVLNKSTDMENTENLIKVRNTVLSDLGEEISLRQGERNEIVKAKDESAKELIEQLDDLKKAKQKNKSEHQKQRRLDTNIKKQELALTEIKAESEMVVNQTTDDLKMMNLSIADAEKQYKKIERETKVLEKKTIANVL